MNYFFKFLIPQLLEYFDNDKEKLLEFIPKIIKDNYKCELENVIYMKSTKNQENCKMFKKGSS